MKTRVTMYLENDVIAFFKGMSEQSGIPYQTIINYYLIDAMKKKVDMNIQFISEEDLDDLREYQVAMEEYRKNPVTYSHQEVLKMFEDGENDV